MNKHRFSKRIVPGIADLNVMPERPEWNKLGPPVPLWFKLQLKRLDPTLHLQFLPPSNWVEPGLCRHAMNWLEFPLGGWQICRKLKRVGWLHRLCVWSLMDRFGRYTPPDWETVVVLRYARNLWRNGLFTKLEDDLDETLTRIQKNKADASFDALLDALDKFVALQGRREFTNRVFHKGGVPTSGGV